MGFSITDIINTTNTGMNKYLIPVPILFRIYTKSPHKHLTEKYILRPASLDDAEDMFEYYKNSKVVKYLPINPHKSISNTKKFIKSFL